MRRFSYFSVAVMAACLPGAPIAYADPGQITWGVLDFPPAFILQHGAAPSSPAELGNGVVDREMFEIVSRMPQYEHKFALFNVQRIWNDLESGHNLCFGSAYKTPEHEAVAYFLPALPATGIGLVMRENAVGAMRAKPSVSLNTVLDRYPERKIYIETARSYGTVLDAILAKNRPSVHRITVSSPGELLHLVDVGRVDYTLEYLSMVEYRQRNGAFQHPLTAIPIEEVPELTTLNIACTRNAWGKKALEDISIALHDAAQSSGIRAGVINWLPSAAAKSLKPKIDRFYEDLAEQPSGTARAR